MRKKIGECLVQAGLISEDDLRVALAEHKRTGERLGVVLVRLNLATEKQIAKALAVQLGFPYVNLNENPPDTAAVLLTFSGADDAAVEGRFEAHGGPSIQTPFPDPAELGRFGYRALFSGTRITAPGGAPIYLPVPKPTIPRPPGCRIELRLVPNINTGVLEHQLLSVCT